jgi:SEC-C motif-containing protein
MIMGSIGFRCIVVLGLVAHPSIAFNSSPPQVSILTPRNHVGRSILLHAKKTSKQKNSGSKSKRNSSSTSGFGGAATEDCPCGSGLGYIKCCGKLHKDANAYADATAEQVVRARYSAYAKRDVDFIVGSTHPLNKNFMSDIEHWKETIKTNCYDNFELTNCEIVDESYEGEGGKEIAKVKFVAKMTQLDSR